MDNYSDIIYLPHHQSKIRGHMPPLERAAQFAPFAALTGFDARIDETVRLTERRPAVSREDAEQINGALRLIMENISARPRVKLTVFVPDERKPGGAPVTQEGNVRRIDTVARVMIFTDKTEIFIDDIFSLDICGLSWYHKE